MIEDKGTYIKYIDWKPTADTEAVLNVIQQIVVPNEAAGMIMTVRQLYYQLVTLNAIANSQASYNRITGIVSNGRLAGLISWTAFEDRNRGLKGIQSYESVGQLIRTARASYHIDAWANQDWRPEVWVEKAALEGVIGHVCRQLRVDYYAQRGYNSQTAAWEAGQRFADYIRKGQRPIVFHLGDHDPSGLDMTRDNAERLSMFVGVPIIVQRLALTKPQIEAGGYPPQPTKMSEKGRVEKYIDEHGYGSWELDAMPTADIHKLIRDAVMQIRDPDRWNEAMEEETNDLRRLDALLEEMGGSTNENED